MLKECILLTRIRRLLGCHRSVQPIQVDDMDRALEHLAAKGLKPRCVLDIGAAKGYWTEAHAWRFRDAEFFMIDPLAESEPFLQSLCKTDRRFHYLLSAVGSTCGEVEMNVSPDCDGSSAMHHPSDDLSRRRKVPLVTIDSLIEQGRISPPQLVKIDVQGFEMQVLDGGQKMFETAEVFIIEANLYEFMPGMPLVHELVAYMAQRGYRVYDMAGFLRRPYENDLAQMDIVFVSNKSPLVASNRWT